MRMKINYINTFFITSILLIFNCSNSKVDENSDPNIVIILLDDMGYGDIESFGAINYTTPNINRLADDGMLFTNFYSAQAVCSASRAGLLTGTYPNRIGIHGALFPKSEVGLNTSEKTIAEVLKEKNYKTAVIGKWHLGHQKKFLPLNHGFDYYYGIPYSNDMWPVDFDGNQIENDNDWRKKNYPQLPIIENFNKVAEVRTLDDQAELTTAYTKKSVDFINKNAESPFFLYVPHSMPHVPIAASKKFKGKSSQGLYGDVIMELDWSLGEIIKALEENNILENTMIVFTSDNGPWLNFGNHAGNTAGLREGKGTVFEGGQRVPTVISWPRVIKKSTISNSLTASIDVFPTITEIVKGKLPEHIIDGVSILDILKGKKTTPRDHFFYYYKTNRLEAVRKDHWKLILPHESRSYENVLPGMDGHGGKYSRITLDYSLYNLRRDPGERYNVIEKYPKIAQSLMDLAETARDDMGDNATGRKGKNTREPGRVN